MADLAPIEIHTSDRALWKRCRRKFEWGSTLTRNLIRIGPDHKAFFLGTGVHFALEDWWGYRRFAHPALAFAAYYDAQPREDLPDEHDAILELATGMLSYYVEDWLEEHPEPYETLWVANEDGVLIPQVEVEIAVDLTPLLLEAVGAGGFFDEITKGREVHYVITLDKAVIDKHERIFGLDYKTAASFDELNLLTNPQVGSYDWAASLFYAPTGYRFEGMYWQQFKKAFPVMPRLVNVGKRNEGLSTAVDQGTTYRLYVKALKEHYGRIPNEERYLEMLAILGNAQGPEGDRYVRLEPLRRNQKQRENEQEKIVQETLEMLDNSLPMYPNPTRDCSYDCAFKDPCLQKDDGSDFEATLESEYVQWRGYKDPWRSKIKWPE